MINNSTSTFQLIIKSFKQSESPPQYEYYQPQIMFHIGWERILSLYLHIQSDINQSFIIKIVQFHT